MVDLRAALPALIALSGSLGMTSCGFRMEGEESKPYAIEIITRERWPEGVPLCAKVYYRGPRFYNARIDYEITPDLPDAVPIDVYQFASGGDDTTEVGLVPADRDSLAFDVVYRTNARLIFNVVKRERISIPVRIEGTAEEILEPVQSDSVDAAIEHGLKVWIVRRFHDESDEFGEWLISIRRFPDRTPEIEALTFAVVVELLREDQVIAATGGWWQQHKPPPQFDHPRMSTTLGRFDDFRSFRLDVPPDFLDAIALEPERWSLRVRSDPIMALRNFDNDRYWEGDVTLPLVVREVRRTWRDGHWKTQWRTVYAPPGELIELYESGVM